MTLLTLENGQFAVLCGRMRGRSVSAPPMTDEEPLEEPQPSSAFAQRLHLALGDRNMSEFCEATGLKYRALMAWRAGENEPRASTVATLARALDVSGDWLLGLIDSPDPIPGTRSWILDEGLEEAVLGVDQPDAENVRELVDMVPRLFSGLGYLPEKWRILTDKDGEETERRIWLAIQKKLPDLFDEWYRLNRAAIEAKPKEE